MLVQSRDLKCWSITSIIYLMENTKRLVTRWQSINVFSSQDMLGINTSKAYYDWCEREGVRPVDAP